MKQISTIFKNNGMVLGYYFKYAPLCIIAQSFYAIFVSFVWLVTGAYSLKFIFDALSKGKSFEEILRFLIAISVLIIVRNILGSYIAEFVNQKGRVTVEENVRMQLYEKAFKMDLAYYETPKFYDEFVWAATQAESRVDRVYGTYMQIVALVSELIFVGGFMIVLDPVLLLFVLVAVASRFIINQKMIKLRYEMQLAAKPVERKRDYSQRVFYQKDYVKELRLSQIHQILHHNFKEATSDIVALYDAGGKK